MSRMGQAKAAPAKLPFALDRMVKIVRDARKDHVMVDFARQIATRYADMVAHFSGVEGRPVETHNNKALFAEGIHLWFRYWFSEGADFRGPTTASVHDVIEHVMAPWYAAMELANPADYRAKITPPPVFVGDFADVVAYELGACACLEIQPLQFVFGMERGEPIHVWGRILADGQWYDSDVSQPEFKLGDRLQFASVERIDVPLLEAEEAAP